MVGVGVGTGGTGGSGGGVAVGSKNTSSPLGTGRCLPSEGELRTFTLPLGRRATIVEEPPPSRLRASSAPRYSKNLASSTIV